MALHQKFASKIPPYALLLDQNVVESRDGMGEKLWPRFTAALFGPNKKISEESIAYFLSVNSFMMVKANMGYFLDSLCCLIFCPPSV